MSPPGLNGWLVQRLRTLDTHFEGYAPLTAFLRTSAKTFFPSASHSCEPTQRISLSRDSLT